MSESDKLMDYFSKQLEEGLHIYFHKDDNGVIIMNALPVAIGYGEDLWDAIREFKTAKEKK